MEKYITIPGSAPQTVPIGHGAFYGDLVLTSGQVSKDLMTGEAKLGTIEEETEQVLKNIGMVLEAAGSGLDCILKTTVFLTDAKYFEPMNKVYAKFFPGEKPGRSAIIIGLAGEYKVEIEAIAHKRRPTL